MMAITKQLSHSHSTPQLSKVAGGSPSVSPRTVVRRDLDQLNTLPDPRAASPSSNYSRNGSTDSSHHPDLSDEVANLSAKLVTAINHQTHLDDTLQATQHDLQRAREYIARLEVDARKREEQMKRMVLKEIADKKEAELRKELAEERNQRIFMEKEKKRIEAELENLTTALFEEANTMVAAARKETEASERKNEQLRNQIKDTESLLASQQEQLQDLKAVMEKMGSDRDETESNLHLSSTPSTPAPSNSDKMTRLFEAANLSPYSPSEHDISPEHPLRFSHLVHPVLRSDLIAYREFQDLFKAAKSLNSAPASRASSGNYSGLNVLGLGGYVTSPSNATGTHQSNGSTSSLASSGALSVSVGNISPRPASTLPPLKENTFYKRALAEDIEPTLRLDHAPGISWMARRTVINSMTVGSLVIEPHPPVRKYRGPVYACSLCGENRVGEKYQRKYRFRTSETEDAQRYPLCDFCLNRMRSTCDYIGFIRMARDGHWRAETEDEVKSAWEESVRLRERMFWSRIGGGVIPAFVQSSKSPEDSGKPKERTSEDASSINSVVQKMDRKDDLFKEKSQEDDKRVSIGDTAITPIEPSASTGVADPATTVIGGDVSPLTPQSQDSGNDDALAAEQLRNEARRPMELTAPKSTLTPPTSPQVAPEEKKERDIGLSIVVPGAFT